MTVRITRVESYRELTQFIKVPFSIYSNDLPWVPPIVMEMKKRLDPRKSPYFDHAEAEYFIAWQDGVPVGRIAAHRNELHEWYHHEPVGFFGFFEAIQDSDVAAALIEAAVEWVQKQDLKILRGPMNFSTNEECGLLVEGFDRPPSVMMPYNPPYYANLLEKVGFTKAKDLWAWTVDRETLKLEIFQEMSRRLRERYRDHLVIKTLTLARLEEDADTLRSIYNDAWSRNWGFVPMTRREFLHMARELKPVADPDFVLVAEWDGVPVGFFISLPDIYVLIRKIRGRLFPFGWWTLLRGLRRLDRCRVITMGIRHKYRRHGIDVILITEFIERGLRKGYREAELSWVLEDNHLMNRPLEKLNARREKVYRIYDLTL